MGDVILKIEKLNKSFGITHANVDVDFELSRGEIRGIVGENGSGKSTLLSQIAGLYGSDSGKMFVKGNEYHPNSPLDANANSIAMIVQELGLIGALPACANIYLGKLKPVVSLKKLQADANAVSDKWGLPHVDMRREAKDMNIENRKMIELIRALSIDPDILILDEVTQSLSHDNRDVLYNLIKKFKDMNRSVILISHDLDEAISITDTLSIMRDGMLLETISSEGVTEEDLKSKMVGRTISGEYYRVDSDDSFEDEVIFSVSNVSTMSGLKDISFELHKGEILAFCGLSDSGTHDIGPISYGLMKPLKGKVFLNKDNVEIKKPIVALQHNMAYVPKDRDGEALMMRTSILNNFVLPSIGDVAGKFGLLSNDKLKKIANANKENFHLKCTGVNQNVSGLSGGNKQKVNLGRWLGKNPNLLIVDCPTRGVDVGVKAYIYDCLKKLKTEGIGTIMITDELTEAIGMADTIYIMKNGTVQDVIKRSEGFREEEIIQRMI